MVFSVHALATAWANGDEDVSVGRFQVELGMDVSRKTNFESHLHVLERYASYSIQSSLKLQTMP